ncbi:hypothetical protein GH733_003915 [Mirounga leonina]|nr:hypothetical protein GH733_003915 [Mirounga leonina]
MPTAGMWGAVGTVGLVWATDWRLILDWVPYINSKCLLMFSPVGAPAVPGPAHTLRMGLKESDSMTDCF